MIVAGNRRITDLGGGRFRFESGGPVDYYLDGGVWRPTDFRAEELVSSFRVFSSGRMALAVRESDGLIRVYPDRRNRRKYVELALRHPATVRKEAGMVHVGGRVTAWNADFDIRFSRTGLKFNLLLKEKASAPNRVRFGLRLAGLYRIGRKVYDAGTDRHLFHLPNPYFTDSHLPPDSGPVDEDILPTGEVALTIDPAELAGKVWPLTIDPTLTTGDSGLDGDTYLDSKRPGNVWDGSAHLWLVAAQGGSGNAPVLVWRDISAIPAGATLESATLSLRRAGASKAPHFEGNPVMTRIAGGAGAPAPFSRPNWYSYRSTAPSLAWNEYGCSWTDTGNDVEYAAQYTHPYGPWEDSLNVINIARKAMDTDRCFALRLKPTSGYYLYWYSSNNAPGLRPVLTIDFHEAVAGKSRFQVAGVGRRRSFSAVPESQAVGAVRRVFHG